MTRARVGPAHLFGGETVGFEAPVDVVDGLVEVLAAETLLCRDTGAAGTSVPVLSGKLLQIHRHSVVDHIQLTVRRQAG